ncbi:hypothetical protein BHM03_00028048 [Ensete ventricosum]|nr:hypothetical protein BHM03_00028048 [Ensete ventricosum]
MSSSSAAFSLDHLSTPPPSEQLCYVHCNFCDTVLAVYARSYSQSLPSPFIPWRAATVHAPVRVSVPFTSLFKTVTVRCGHCTNLLSVNMRGLHLPPANQIHVTHPCLTPSYASLLEGEDVLPKDGFYATAAAANMGVAPF